MPRKCPINKTEKHSNSDRTFHASMFCPPILFDVHFNIDCYLVAIKRMSHQRIYTPYILYMLRLHGVYACMYECVCVLCTRRFELILKRCQLQQFFIVYILLLMYEHCDFLERRMEAVKQENMRSQALA